MEHAAVRVLREAIRRVPVLRFALGLAGVGAAAALARFFLPDVNLQALFLVLFAFILMMVLLLIVSVAAGSSNQLSRQAQLITWSVSLFSIVVMAFTLSALMFGWPSRWANIILPSTAAIIQPGAISEKDASPSILPSKEIDARSVSGSAKPKIPSGDNGIFHAAKRGTTAKIYYYAKPTDGSTVRTALSQAGIDYIERPTAKQGRVPTNAISCSGDVSADDLQKVIRALRSANIDIRIIRQFENQKKSNRIEILTFSWESITGEELQILEPPLSNEQLFSITKCPYMLQNPVAAPAPTNG
ncbi:hypothetical protein [Sphingomonas sp. ERG5]|uniref:hypothetical protein n=1 Tax=Sphingomonas sp. ERG5 TaxID=1381597 RepID=UPI00126A3C75|nr:hypothetical protein [Sphingomonas sp. ERG5]